MTKRDFDRQANSRWPKYANDFEKRPRHDEQHAWANLDPLKYGGHPIEDTANA